MIKKTKIFLIVLFGFLIIPIMIFSQTEEYTIKAVFYGAFYTLYRMARRICNKRHN